MNMWVPFNPNMDNPNSLLIEVLQSLIVILHTKFENCQIQSIFTWKLSGLLLCLLLEGMEPVREGPSAHLKAYIKHQKLSSATNSNVFLLLTGCALYHVAPKVLLKLKAL